MKLKIPYKLILLLGSLFLLPQSFWPQQSADSILIIANRQIHENPSLAIEMGQKIVEDTESTIDVKVNALIIISTAYSSKREYERSLEYSRKALDFLPKISNVDLKIKILNRIGAQYQELNVYDKALNYLDEAYNLLKTLPESVEKSKALGFNNLVRGFIYREQMSCEIALDYFNSSIKAYKTISSEFNVNSNLSTAFYNKGNCFLTLNKIEEAKESYLQSIVYAKKNNAKSLVAFANKGLASVYTTEKDPEKAIYLLKEALQNSEEVGDKILNRSIYRALANNYLIESDIKNYAFYNQENLSINKEIIKTERKTIDRSVQNIMDLNSQKIVDYQKRNILFIAILTLLIIAGIGLIIRSIYTSGKTLKDLKKELKF